MTDDPREILQAAGVECPEVEDYEFSVKDMNEYSRYREITGLADAAITTLSRLVAEYKWQRDECADDLGRKLAADYEYEVTKQFAASDVIVGLNRRWAEHNA